MGAYFAVWQQNAHSADAVAIPNSDKAFNLNTWTYKIAVTEYGVVSQMDNAVQDIGISQTAVTGHITSAGQDIGLAQLRAFVHIDIGMDQIIK